MNQRLREQLVDALQHRAAPGLRGRGPARPRRPLRHRRRSPASPSCAIRRSPASTQPRLQGEDGKEADVMGAMREGDVLVHHPYDSFSTSVESFVQPGGRRPRRARDQADRLPHEPRLDPGPVLIEASERGKQAVCMVELKARFDEQANIRWAKKLEEAGVHVVYGIPALKTHVQVHPRRPPRGRRRAPLRPHRDRQLQPEDRAPLHRRRPVHRRPRPRRRHRRDVQLPDRLLAAAPLPQGAGRAVRTSSEGILERDRAHDRGAHAPSARRGSG